MRSGWVTACVALSACIVGEDPNFIADAPSGTGTDGESAGTDTGTTGTTDTGTTDTGTTDTGTTDAGTTDTTETGGVSEHRIFVTSTLYAGDLGGLAGADAKCQARADAANLGGAWKALLSAGNTSARDRLTIGDRVLNMIGEEIAVDDADLWDAALAVPVLYDEHETARPGDVWTGSAIDGTASGVDCKGWTGTAASGHRGGAEDSNNDWLNRGFRFCDWTLALYCVSQ